MRSLVWLLRWLSSSTISVPERPGPDDLDHEISRVA